ncbi:MAG: M48 family metallopeptidase, partial [Rhodospirillales bacterium]|nr:M48 family metallopeptidase [Rhodospirillales bacterium]
SHGRLVPLLMALGLGSALLTFLVVLPVLAKFAAATLPVEWERRWGKHIAAQIVREAGRTCEAPAAQAALNGLAGRLARAAGYTGPVQVTVLPSKSVNAFAVPGGAIFVLDGLIQEARSDEELAGVLGHEVAHVQRRHSLERMAAQSGAVALTAIATGDVISPFSGAVLWLLGQSYSRDQEAEADRLGMEMLSRLGIATAPTRDLFRRMGAAAPGGGLWERLLSDHPQAEQRIRAIPDNPGRARALADRDWKEIREMCRKTSDGS